MNKENALTWAIITENTKVAKALIDAGVNVNACYKYAIDFAIRNKKVEVVTLLELARTAQMRDSEHQGGCCG